MKWLGNILCFLCIHNYSEWSVGEEWPARQCRRCGWWDWRDDRSEARKKEDGDL